MFSNYLDPGCYIETWLTASGSRDFVRRGCFDYNQKHKIFSTFQQTDYCTTELCNKEQIDFVKKVLSKFSNHMIRSSKLRTKIL